MNMSFLKWLLAVDAALPQECPLELRRCRPSVLSFLYERGDSPQFVAGLILGGLAEKVRATV